MRVAGGLKRAEPDVHEDKILLRALRDFNMPKIVSEDQQIFLRLISDLFVGLEIARKTDKTLSETCALVAKERHLQVCCFYIMLKIHYCSSFQVPVVTTLLYNIQYLTYG